jgi:hypothetical protein
MGDYGNETTGINFLGVPVIARHLGLSSPIIVIENSLHFYAFEPAMDEVLLIHETLKSSFLLSWCKELGSI